MQLLLQMVSKILNCHDFIQHLIPFLWSHRLDMIDEGVGIIGWGSRCVIVSFFCGVILTLFFILVIGCCHSHFFFMLLSSIRTVALHMPLESASKALSFSHVFVLLGIVCFEAFVRSVTGVVSEDSCIDVHCVRVPLGLLLGWTS